MNPSILQQKSVTDFYSMVKGNLESGNPEINACNLAYNDVKRTLRGFGKCSEKDRIKLRIQELLQTELLSFFQNPVTENSFDERHFLVCKKMKDIFFGCHTLTFGQAQKWLNMFFKYMYLADKRMNRLLPYLHIPIDNVMLNGIERSNYPGTIGQYVPKCRPWSRLDDYAVYIGFQRAFRRLFEKPLLQEFYLWNRWRQS